MRVAESVSWSGDAEEESQKTPHPPFTPLRGDGDLSPTGRGGCGCRFHKAEREAKHNTSPRWGEVAAPRRG